MLFLNIGLLFGLAAVAIPIIIHLLHRRSEKKIDWGAMQFLLDSLVRRRRRILIEEILLLGTRCLLLALLALALARPFIPAGSQVPWIIVMPMLLLAIAAFGASVALWRYPRWRRSVFLGAVVLIVVAGLSVLLERWLNLKRFGAGRERDVVMIIDGSSSMTVAADGISNFERALEEAEAIIGNAGRQTAFGLILGSDVPSARLPTPVSDRRTLIGELDDLRPTHGAMRALDSLALAAVILAQGYNPSKQIVVITDGQDLGWETDSPARWQFLADTFANLPSPPQIIVRRLGLPVATRNLGVAEVSVSRDVVGTDRPVTITVRVENTGSEAVTPSDVRLEIGDVTLTDASMDQLEPGESETVKFSHQFKRAGMHVVTARVTVSDDLLDDDTGSITLSALERLPVLIVDGNPSSRFLERAGAFAQLALSPQPEAEDGAAGTVMRSIRYLVDPTVVPAPDILQTTGFGQYGAVILADVPRLPAATARDLEKYVRAGGGLLIAPGPRSDAGFYNGWQDAKGVRICPAHMERQILLGEDEKVFSPSITTFTHPALRVVADASQSDIGSVSFSSYWKLQEDALDTAASVGGRLNTGDPILVEKLLGEGAVLQLCFPLDTQFGNVATRHAFVPMLHEMVYYLAQRGGAGINLPPGQGLELQLTSRGSATAGLRAEYFRDREMKKSVLTRVDPGVDFGWAVAAPVPGMPADNFTVRWTGSLVPEVTGEYTIDADVDDRINVWVDGAQIIRQRGQARLDLERGKRYDLRVEFAEDSGNATARLMWSSKTIPRTVIPSSSLSTVRGASVLQQADGALVTASDPVGLDRAVRLSVGDGAVVATVRGDVVPGVYHIRASEALKEMVPDLLDEDGRIPFAVLRDLNESRLLPLDEADAEFIRQYADYVEAKSVDHVRQALEGKTFGEEVWKYLALGAFALLLIEILLTRWIASQRGTGEIQDVEFEERTGPSAAFRNQLERVRRATSAKL